MTANPVLRPASSISDTDHTAGTGATSPKAPRRVRPGWKPTLITDATYQRLRAIQKSTTDPTIDLSYLTEAALLAGLDHGAEAIVSRAWDVMRLPRRSR